MQKSEKPPVLAVDLGGTKIIAAIVSSMGQVMGKMYRLSGAGEGPEAVISRMFSAIDELLDSGNIALSQLGSISVASAGAIDLHKGVVTASPNLPGWHDIPLRAIVKERYKVDTFLLNDASAATLGEHRFGAGRGVNNLVLLTVGTGIGGGIIINGELYSGISGSAGEIGHMTIDMDGSRDKCGNIGCLEAFVSGKTVEREAIDRIQRGEKSSLVDIVAGRIEEITAEKVSMAAQTGDSLASEVILKAAICLGAGLVNLVNIFNPEMIIIGGGMAEMGDLLLEPARQVVRERAFRLAAEAVKIVPAQLGNDAGVLGAAVFAFEQ
jgi:glucokinase